MKVFKLLMKRNEEKKEDKFFIFELYKLLDKLGGYESLIECFIDNKKSNRKK